MKVIIYQHDKNIIAVIYPANQDDFLSESHGVSNLKIEEIAKRDVPFGIPYKIMESDSVPENTFGWEVDFKKNDGIGADYGVGSKWAVKAYSIESDELKPTVFVNSETKEIKGAQ